MRFARKSGAIQVMAIVSIIAIAAPAIIGGFMLGWGWFFILTALLLVPAWFLERRGQDRF